MSIKRYVNGKWVEIAGSGGSSVDTSDAVNVSIRDSDDLFESRNVEGALNELSYAIKSVDNELTNHKNNHPTGGGGGSMPTITSDFTISKSDGISEIIIPIFFNSPSLGEGLVYVLVNNVEVATQTVQQGNNNVVVPPLGAGRNIIISIYVKDRAGLLSNQMNWTVTSGGISLTMLTDTNADYGVTSRIVLAYTIVCMTNEDIKVYFNVDGTLYEADGINGYNTYEITGLTMGVHKIEYWATSAEYETKHSIFTLIVVSTDEIIISTEFDTEAEYESGIPISIPYRVAIDRDEDFTVNTYIDGVIDKTIITRPGQLYWTITSLDPGFYTLKIEAYSEKLGISNYLEFSCTVVEGEYARIQPVMDNSLLAWFDATNRTNNDSDRDTWIDKFRGNTAKLYNFNYGSNGWLKQDGKEISHLVCNGTCYVEVDMTPFKDNFKNGGLVEILFKSRDVGNAEARILDATDTLAPYRGVYINTREAYLSTSNQTIYASVGEEEYIHVMYNIDRINKYAHVVINGVITKSCKLSDTGSGTSAILESIANSQKMYLNCQKGTSNFGSCEIAHLRIYDRNFTFDEMLQNYLSTFDDLKIQKSKYDFNNPLSNIMPVMNITCDIDRFETMTDTNKVEVAMTYTSPNAELYGETLTTATNCLMYWQGTSSVGYNVHNYNILLRDENRQEIMYTPYKDGIPQSLFCLKVNLMESTNAHNVGMADFVHNYLYSTPNDAQKVDPRVRRTVAGFPFLLYINGEAMGVYDFNLDRYSTKAFGYELEEFKNTCRAYEISANTNRTAGAFIPWSASTGVDEWTWYKNDFVGIYPLNIQNSINDDFKELKTLISWVYNSTDEEFITNFATYFDKESVVRYYILVMFVGAVDSLGKNAKLVTFNGIKWYFDFYDMDTIFGLDNTGALKYDVDIEVTPEQFNTADSILWTRVRTLFYNDIVAEYNTMRNNNLTLERIYECVFEKQIEKIPESQYNFSTQKKYLDTGEYIMMSNGNRYYNLKRWIKERIIYCDTLFEYTPTTARYITLRSGVEGSTYLDIQTYYPMYVTVEWRNQADGSGRQTLKVGRNKTVRFNGVVQAKDQEVMVYGAEHLKNIGRMDGLRPRHLLLNNAYRLTSVECPNNTELLSVQMEQCTYLQRVDLNGCTSLGTLMDSQVLNVSGCDNLRYLNTYNTALTSITTNQNGGNLVEIYVPKTLQTLSLKNQYSLTTVGIPSSTWLSSTANDLQSNASKIATFSLVNCPLVNRLNYSTSYSLDHDFYDEYMNQRTRDEFSKSQDYNKWLQLAKWGSGLANATEIYIENSCHSIEHMSFRGMENISAITLRNLPNLKTLLLGSNCSGCRWNNAPNYDADKYDLIGEFDWNNFNIIDCNNIEEFRIHEFRPNQSQTWFTFKPGTNSINLGDKFPNLKLFECNLATQNIHQIILPQTLKTFMNTTWSGFNGTAYPHRWVYEKFNIDSVFFEGEHDLSYTGVDLGNHALTNTRVTAPYAPHVIGLNIKNEYVNPQFNSGKEYGNTTRPIIVPNGVIDVSEFKWRVISSWFAYIDFTNDTCQIIQPPDWDEFLKNVTRAYNMFTRCINPNFTWEFAMKFFPLIQSEGDMRSFYKYAQLKPQNSYVNDGVEMYNTYPVAQYNYHESPFQGSNLKYVKKVTLTSTSGCSGLFRNSNVVKVGDIICSGTNTWGGWWGCFRGCTSLEEVGNLTSITHPAGSSTALESHELFYGCHKLIKMGELDYNVSNASHMYRECYVLPDSGIHMPNLEKITNCHHMFSNCDALTNIHLEGIDRDSAISDMSYMFHQCNNLEVITTSGNIIPISVNNMNHMYAGSPKLLNLIPIPDDFTYNVNMSYCCEYCYALTDKAIYKYLPFRITDVSYMYQHCTGLKNPVVELDCDNVYARNMFHRCSNMESLTVEFNGRLLRNSQFFASYCPRMQTVSFKFPDSITMNEFYETGVSYYNMFEYCENLYYVNLDMSSLYNTNTKADFGGMFYQCKYIKEIHGLDFTFLKPPAHGWNEGGNGWYDSHSDSVTYGASFTDLEVFNVTGLLSESYNFRNITTPGHTKTILQNLDVVTSETIGLTYNVMDAIDDEKNEYVDPVLQQLAYDAINKGWTFTIV